MIGTGVIGAAVAYELAQTGLRVVAIDRLGGVGSGLYQLVLKHRPLSLLDLRGRGRFLGIQVQLADLALIPGQPS